MTARFPAEPGIRRSGRSCSCGFSAPPPAEREPEPEPELGGGGACWGRGLRRLHKACAARGGDCGWVAVGLPTAPSVCWRPSVPPDSLAASLFPYLHALLDEKRAIRCPRALSLSTPLLRVIPAALRNHLSE